MDPNDTFDWSNPRSLVVKRVDPIAIYKSSDGDIAIRQQLVAQQDAVIIIPLQQAYAVIEALTRQVKGLPPTLPATGALPSLPIV